MTGVAQFPRIRSQGWKGLPVSPATEIADTPRPTVEEGPQAPGRGHSPPTCSLSRRKSHRKQERGTSRAGERLAFPRVVPVLELSGAEKWRCVTWLSHLSLLTTQQGRHHPIFMGWKSQMPRKSHSCHCQGCTDIS